MQNQISDAESDGESDAESDEESDVESDGESEVESDAESEVEDPWAGDCCFSPDGKLVVITAYDFVYVWDITNPEPCLLETFIDHVYQFTSPVFSSPTSLILASGDGSVQFWQIGASSTSLDVTDPVPHTSIKSITLQAKDGIAISSDSDGVVRTWDLLTGLCNASFQTPVKGDCLRNARLIDNRLVLIWYSTEKIHVWDVEKQKLLQTVDAPWNNVEDLRISEDGSKVFCMKSNTIYAWCIWTGEVMGEVDMGSARYIDSFLNTDGSRVWAHLPGGIKGWDFGVPDSSSIKKCTEPPNRPHLDFIGGIRNRRTFLPGIEDTTTGKEVFRLPSRYARPNDAQWDGQYLVAGYDFGEVLILDCNCTLAH
jgi:WD40 repeat protein